MATENTENKPAHTRHVVAGLTLGGIGVVALVALLVFLVMRYMSRMVEFITRDL
jgi:flagellar biogenesis protein FliO